MYPTRLLPTKLNIPRPRSELVERHPLLAKISTGLRSGCRLTLICAPAGYGKTTLAADWARNNPDVTWYSLSAEDSDPLRFLGYVIAAFQKLDLSIGEAAQNILQLPRTPPIETLAGDLITDLQNSQRGIVLVLDDYHTIQDAEVHDILNLLMDNAPDHVHFIITTREDPPLPLARMRARGQMIEIRARDLQFTRPEIEIFCQSALNETITSAQLEHLERITEGWIAGLQLAGLAVGGQGNMDALLDSLENNHRYIIDYLMDEVLKNQPQSIRGFLKNISVLDRFNASLCAAVFDMEVTECAEVLDDLDRRNLFIVQLDSSRDWYRFHHLFGDTLRAGLNSSDEVTIHSKAAAWFDQNGMISEALKHHLTAGDISLAAHSVDKASHGMLNHGEMRTLLDLIALLPISQINLHPNLQICQAAALIFIGEAIKAVGILNRISTADHNIDQDGRYLTLRALINLYSGNTQNLLEEAQSALRLLPEEEIFFRVVALQILATACQWAGNYQDSSKAYEEAYLLGRQMNNPFAELTALANLVYDLIDMGQMRRAEELCQNAVAMYTDHRGRPLPILGLIYNPLCTIRYEQNRLDEAETLGNISLELSKKLFSAGMTGGDAEVKLAEIAFARNNYAAGWEIINRIRKQAREGNIAFLLTKMDFLEISYQLRYGDPKIAADLLESLEKNPQASFPSAQYTRLLMLNQYNLLTNDPARVIEDCRFLHEVYQSNEVSGRLLLVLLQQAQAYLAMQDREKALQALSEALRLAAPEGYLRQFLRLKNDIVPLIKELHPSAPGFVDAILASMQTSPPDQPDSRPVPGNEPLSKQELLILQLLAAGKTNQEISEALFISVGTAKWHVHNILSKLGASNRAQAASRARDMGLSV